MRFYAFRASFKLQSVTPDQRQCAFLNESNLIYYPDYYTRTLCLLTCRMQTAMKFCKCIPFFYGNVSKFDHAGCEECGRKLISVYWFFQIIPFAQHPVCIAYPSIIGIRKNAIAFHCAIATFMSYFQRSEMYAKKFFPSHNKSFNNKKTGFPSFQVRNETAKNAQCIACITQINSIPKFNIYATQFDWWVII